MKMFYNCSGYKLSLKEQGNHHRLAMLAGWLDAKSHMANHLLFRKENDFCMTFGSAISQPTPGWLANLLIIQALFITISF